jgi:energy-coupling factor transporter ATP-binding protein EcfA2
MTFVGRERETARILAAVSAGRHVVITGKFGMGKTALARHVAGLAAPDRPFLFASSSLSPARICEALVLQLPTLRRGRAGRKAPVASYLSLRARLVAAPSNGPAPVVVLDDVSRVTAPKAGLIHQLDLAGILLIVLLDTGLPERDRTRLLVRLEPAEKVHLGPLDLTASAELFERLSTHYRLGWSTRQIEGLARASGGYPLRIHEIATRGRPRPPC